MLVTTPLRTRGSGTAVASREESMVCLPRRGYSLSEIGEMPKWNVGCPVA